MKILFIFIIQFLLIFCCGAQSRQDTSKNRVRLILSVGAGQSIFSSNILKSQSKFPTTEVRLGFGVIKPIGMHFDLITCLNIGSKIKGDRAYPPGSSPPGVSLRLAPPFNDLEETVNSRNHYFFEIPMLIQFDIFDGKIGFSTGGNYRHFFSNNGYMDSSGQYSEGPDFLSGKKEFGILSGVAIRIFGNLRLLASYCFGVTRVNAVHYAQLNTFTDIRYDIRNQFSLVALEYSIKKRNGE